MGARVRPAKFLILDKWLRGDGKKNPEWDTLTVLVNELVEGDVAEGSHLGQLLALAGLKVALLGDSIDSSCAVFVKALLQGGKEDDKELLLRSQTEAVLEILRQRYDDDDGGQFEHILEATFSESSNDIRVEARREELKLAWEGGSGCAATQNLFSRFPSAGLKADLRHLTQQVEARLPPPLLNRLFKEAEKGALERHLPASCPSRDHRCVTPPPPAPVQPQPHPQPQPPVQLPVDGRSSAAVVALLVTIAGQELRKKVGEAEDMVAKGKEKRKVEVKILKLKVEVLRKLPLTQEEMEGKERKLQDLEARLKILGAQMGDPTHDVGT